MGEKRKKNILFFSRPPPRPKSTAISQPTPHNSHKSSGVNCSPLCRSHLHDILAKDVPPHSHDTTMPTNASSLCSPKADNGGRSEPLRQGVPPCGRGHVPPPPRVTPC